MTVSLTGLIIQPDGSANVRVIEAETSPRLANALCDIVQAQYGYLEAIFGPNWCAYLNEEGKREMQEPNPAATALALELGWRRRPGDIIVGPVVFLGREPGDPDEKDVPPEIITIWERLSLQVKRAGNGA